jgi:hypothetical protein
MFRNVHPKKVLFQYNEGKGVYGKSKPNFGKDDFLSRLILVFVFFLFCTGTLRFAYPFIIIHHLNNHLFFSRRGAVVIINLCAAVRYEPFFTPDKIYFAGVKT